MLDLPDVDQLRSLIRVAKEEGLSKLSVGELSFELPPQAASLSSVETGDVIEGESDGLDQDDLGDPAFYLERRKEIWERNYRKEVDGNHG